GRLRTENDHTPSAPPTTTPAASTARTDAANVRLAELSTEDFSFDGPRSSFVHVVEPPDIALDVLHGSAPRGALRSPFQTNRGRTTSSHPRSRTAYTRTDRLNQLMRVQA